MVQLYVYYRIVLYLGLRGRSCWYVASIFSGYVVTLELGFM